jgi:hypothetical protein
VGEELNHTTTRKPGLVLINLSILSGAYRWPSTDIVHIWLGMVGFSGFFQIRFLVLLQYNTIQLGVILANILRKDRKMFSFLLKLHFRKCLLSRTLKFANWLLIFQNSEIRYRSSYRKI